MEGHPSCWPGMGERAAWVSRCLGPAVSHAVSAPLPAKLLGLAPPPALPSRTVACSGRPSRRRGKALTTGNLPPLPGSLIAGGQALLLTGGAGGLTPGRPTTRATIRVRIGVPPAGQWQMTVGGQKMPPYNGSRWRNAPATTAPCLYRGRRWEIRQDGGTGARLRNQWMSGAAASLKINVKGDGGDVKREKSTQRGIHIVGAAGDTGS
jgi:hypothetical protein